MFFNDNGIWRDFMKCLLSAYQSFSADYIIAEPWSNLHTNSNLHWKFLLGCCVYDVQGGAVTLVLVCRVWTSLAVKIVSVWILLGQFGSWKTFTKCNAGSKNAPSKCQTQCPNPAESVLFELHSIYFRRATMIGYASWPQKNSGKRLVLDPWWPLFYKRHWPI